MFDQLLNLFGQSPQGQQAYSALQAQGYSPTQSAGILTSHQHWRSIGQATMSYGYGLSVTPLQLAQACTEDCRSGIIALLEGADVACPG